MSLFKQINDEEIDKIAWRLKSCRVLTGRKQEQFAEETKIGLTTIRNWEHGKAVPRRQSVADFVVGLRAYNIFVDCDWILFGSGPGPIIDGKSSESTNLSTDARAFIANSKSNGKDPLVITVNDNSMAPWFCEGDLLGGVLIDGDELKELLSSNQARASYPVLVKLSDGAFAPRLPKLLNQKLVFASHENVLDVMPTPVVALIKWHEVKHPHVLNNN